MTTTNTVTVVLDIDTSRLDEAMEQLRVVGYRNRIRMERLDARRHVDGLLDDLCRRWGFNPDLVWRGPRWFEEQARRDRARLHLAASYAPRILDPKSAFKTITDVS